MLPEPEIVPFDAIVMPGGSPVAVKVRVCDALESTACMANDIAVPFQTAVAEGVDDADRFRARHAQSWP